MKIYVHANLYTNVHGIIIHQNMEITQMVQKINYVNERKRMRQNEHNGESGYRGYERSSLYYSCNFPVSLKLYQNKK